MTSKTIHSDVRVLIIGGTQFMGRHLVSTLLLETGFTIGLLNRGKTTCPFEIDNRRIFHFPCDRFDSKNFRRIIQETGPWDFVVDFLCFRKRHAKDAVRGLWTEFPVRSEERRRLKLYIFISSDSVYMACRRPLKGKCCSSIDPTDLRICESDAVPATENDDIEALRANNAYQFRYGGNKLEVEHYLRSQWLEAGFPFIALRLPDVIGPYDNLTGFLDLRHAVLRGKRIGLEIGSCCKNGKCNGKTHRISIVFAADVAQLIKNTMLRRLHFEKPSLGKHNLYSNVESNRVVHTASDDASNNGCAGINNEEKVPFCILGQSFNVSCEEAPTFTQFVQDCVAKSLGVTELRWSKKNDPPMVSVDVGPLCIDQAKEKLQFTPTPLADAVKLTLAWLEDASHRKYTRELDDSSSSSDSDSKRVRNDSGNDSDSDSSSDSDSDQLSSS